jgi:hypothetical protein
MCCGNKNLLHRSRDDIMHRSRVAEKLCQNFERKRPQDLYCKSTVLVFKHKATFSYIQYALEDILYFI